MILSLPNRENEERKTLKNKTLWIVLGTLALIIVIAVSTFVGKYNGFVTAEENVDNKWAQVENQMQRRADLIPNLIETVKGYASHEQAAIDSVTEARAQMTGAKTPGDLSAADAQMTGALSRLMVVVENYPDLKANTNFLALQDSLEGTENRIAVERKTYNDEVAVFNKNIKTFPNSMIAGAFGFEKKEYFEVTEEAKENPKVDFGTEDKK